MDWGQTPHNPLAVRRIFAAKGRPLGHPLIAHLPSLEWLEHWSHINSMAMELAQRFWPGPLTLILPKTSDVPDEVTGGLPTIGLRMPDHPIAQALLEHHGAPIAAPSANRFLAESAQQKRSMFAQGESQIGREIVLLDGGPSSVGVESTIIDLVDPSGTVATGCNPPGCIKRSSVRSELLPHPLRYT